MADVRRKRDPLAVHFASAEEAGELGDAHDLADYRDQTHEGSSEVNIQAHRFLTPLEPELAQNLLVRARQRGISTETLINV